VHRTWIKAPNSGVVKGILREVIAPLASASRQDDALVADVSCVELNDDSPWAEALSRDRSESSLIAPSADLPSILGAANYHFDWLALAVWPQEALEPYRSSLHSEGWTEMFKEQPVLQCPNSLLEIYVWDDTEFVVLAPAGSPHEGAIEVARLAAEREDAEVVE
jgi:hypothetical protein